MAEKRAVADNEGMRLVCLSFAPLLLLACPGPSGFTPEEPDAGFVDEGVTAEDIGAPCTYDPANPANPTNQCPAGTDCVIVTRDGAFNPLGMSLVFWEDQFTVALADVDVGYCSLIGNVVAPPACPVGTFTKLVTSPSAAGGFAALCVRPCTSSAECGPDRVCDARFLDINASTCVSPCRTDLSHCVRSAVVVVNDQGQSATALFDGDLFGDAVCNLQTGLCADTQKGLGSDGATCTSSADCTRGHACYQAALFPGEPEFGFCAQRCTNGDGSNPPAGTCEAGEACQPGLDFGNPSMIVSDFAGGLASLEGICLDRCVEGVTECIPGTDCGATDASIIGQAWVEEPMCAPEAIKEPD